MALNEAHEIEDTICVHNVRRHGRNVTLLLCSPPTLPLDGSLPNMLTGNVGSRNGPRNGSSNAVLPERGLSLQLIHRHVAPRQERDVELYVGQHPTTVVVHIEVFGNPFLSDFRFLAVSKKGYIGG